MHQLVNLATLPTDIVEELVPYLDTMDLISLAQVSQTLRHYLIHNTSLWSYLLRNRMNINHGPRSKMKPYDEILRLIPSRLCRGCKSIEQRPLFHGLFRIHLCTQCRQSPKYILITATRAKQEYRLNNHDLSSLRVLKAINPHYKNAAPMRLYHIDEVKAASIAKMEALQTTVREHKRTASLLGESIKKGKRAAVEKRRTQLIEALEGYGLVIPPESRLCDAFAGNIWHGYGHRWSLDEVVRELLRVHYLHDHSCFHDMLQDSRYREEFAETFQDELDGLLYIVEQDAFEFLKKVEAEVGAGSGISVCACGKLNLQAMVAARWQQRP
jgi:hypothetical protein